MQKKNLLKKAVECVAEKSAMWDVETACFAFLYQPKQPKALKKCKESK